MALIITELQSSVHSSAWIFRGWYFALTFFVFGSTCKISMERSTNGHNIILQWVRRSFYSLLVGNRLFHCHICSCRCWTIYFMSRSSPNWWQTACSGHLSRILWHFQRWFEVGIDYLTASLALQNSWGISFYSLHLLIFLFVICYRTWQGCKISYSI